MFIVRHQAPASSVGSAGCGSRHVDSRQLCIVRQVSLPDLCVKSEYLVEKLVGQF
jgi:hypothetical protein